MRRNATALTHATPSRHIGDPMASSTAPQRSFSRLLIIEDDAAQLQTLLFMMQAEGFEVTGCQSAAAALAHMQSTAFEVAIVDLRLPDLDGVTLVARLRALSPTIRIIVYTAYGSFADAKSLLNLGAFAYVEKLDDPQELVRHTHRAMHEQMNQYAAYLEEEVTARTQALHESEQWLELALSAAGMATWEWDPPAQTFRHSKTYPALFGLPPEQNMSFTLWERCLHPEDRQPTREQMQRALTSGESYRNEYRVVFPDGTVHWISSQGRIARDDTGRSKRIIGASLDITQRKQAEADLRQARDELAQRVAERTSELQHSQTLLHGIINNTTAVIYAKQRDGRYLLLNRQAEKVLNVSGADSADKTDYDLFPQDIAAALRANDQRVLSSGEALETEEILSQSDGLHTYLSIKVPLHDATGTPYGVCGISTDITERKQTAERLQQQTAALMGLWQANVFKPGAFQKTLQEITRIAAHTLQTERVSVWLFNEARSAIHCLTLYEKQVERYSAGLELTAVDYPAYFRALEESLIIAADDALTDARTCEFATPYLTPVGITSMLDAPIRLEEGLIGVLCHEQVGPHRQWLPDEQMFAASLADLVALVVQTNRRFQAEQALRASEERLDLALHGADLGLWDWHIPTGVLTYDKRALEMLDYPSLGGSLEPLDTWKSLVHPEDLPHLRAVCEAHVRGDTPSYEAEFRMQTASREWRWFFSRGKVVERDAEGRPLRATGTQLDITERKRTEQEQTRLATILETTPDLVAIVHASQDTLMYLNQAGRHMLGYGEKEDITRLSLADCGIADIMTNVILPQLQHQGTWSGELTLHHQDGHALLVLVTAIAHKTSDESVPFVSMVGRDMTAYKHLEQQLLQAQKLEAIGRLAGGVAHDFNNLLTVIIGCSDLILLQSNSQHPSVAMAAEIKKAGQRAAALIRQLLAFSRKQVLAPIVLHLHHIIRDMETMIQRLIGADITLTLQLVPELRKVRVDPSQMEQVLLNLVVNARDAMPTGGQLTITTGNIILDAVYTKTYPDLQPGPYVMLTVADTGCGMDATTQAHMFEPFFTTKERGKGTGLGLATVFGIVKQSGGHIEVMSTVGQGTTLSIYLPQVDEVQDVPPSRHTAVAGALQGTETVLVVEDETSIRALVRLTLQRAGYNVLEAQDGDSALDLYATHSGPLHLLITDAIMPGMSGQQLGNSLQALQPHLKLLLMSGYTEDTLAQRGVRTPEMHFLPKPFTPDALLRTIRQVLDGMS